MNVIRTSVAAVSTVAIALSLAGPLAAWHPKGVIKKEVMNQTTGSTLSDANGAAAAIAAKPGDVLKYVITVSNVGEKDSKGYNDMAKTVMTDTLPAGVELVTSASQRQITENLGTIKPGESVKKEYLVKVTSQKDGQVIENQACFTGNSTANDNPQKGCDIADVKVNVPVTPTPPVTPPTTPTPTPEVPAVLPSTGPEALVAGVAGLTGVAYGVNAYLRSRRNLLTAHKR